MGKEKMQDVQNPPPILRQIVGAILGVLFAVTGGYSGLEFIFALLFSPVLLAGVIRLVTGLYRIASKFTGQRVYDEFGQCILVLPRPGISFVLAIVGLGCVISILVYSFRFATFAGVAVTSVLMALEIYIFLKDFRNWKQIKGQKQIYP